MLWQIYARYPHAEYEWAAECYATGMIAVGWSFTGDLREFASQEEVRAVLLDGWPDYYEGEERRCIADGGSLWRFAYEVQVGDLVICPDDRRKCLYVGEIASHYFLEDESGKSDTCDFLHRREMNWFRGITRAEARGIWGPGRVGSIMTAARVHTGEAELRDLIRQKAQRKPGKARGSQTRPDSAWGRAAELRALEWLTEEGFEPRDVAHLCVGWDIECGPRKYEVKGRRTPATVIRLTENEYSKAEEHKGQYLILVFTAETLEELAEATPEVIPDPTRTREWGVRTVKEYLLSEW